MPLSWYASLLRWFVCPRLNVGVSCKPVQLICPTLWSHATALYCVTTARPRLTFSSIASLICAAAFKSQAYKGNLLSIPLCLILPRSAIKKLGVKWHQRKVFSVPTKTKRLVPSFTLILQRMSNLFWSEWRNLLNGHYSKDLGIS